MKRKPTRPSGAILLIGTSETSPDLEYASGFHAVDPVVFLRAGEAGSLVVPEMEFGRASRNRPGTRVFTPETLGLSGPARGRLRDWTLRLLKHHGVRSVIVSGAFPLGVARYLEHKGIRVTVDAQPLFPQRAIKTAEELRWIRESQQAAVIAMRTAIAAITAAEPDRHRILQRHGKVLTSESVRELIAKTLFEQNCQARDIIVAGGAQAADPHENGAGPLRAGEAIIIDIFPKHTAHGYWGDLTRTVARGKASPFMRKVYHAVRAAQTAALSRVKAGVKASSVHAAAVEAFKRRGLHRGVTDGKSTGFIHSTGHGVGLAIHELPSISTADGRLKSGNVITIEPGLYYPGVGGVRIEDTIVVTASGWRYLAPCEKRFEV